MRKGGHALLQLPPFISELADLLQQDADLAREGLAEVIDVPSPQPWSDGASRAACGHRTDFGGAP